MRSDKIGCVQGGVAIDPKSFLKEWAEPKSTFIMIPSPYLHWHAHGTRRHSMMSLTYQLMIFCFKIYFCILWHILIKDEESHFKKLLNVSIILKFNWVSRPKILRTTALSSLTSLMSMSLRLPWQSIAWSCSGNLQEVAINIIKPHTNPLGILKTEKVAIITLENLKSLPTLI